MDPLPTPFDILPLPGLPLRPSPIAWGLLLLLLGIGLFLATRKSKSRVTRFEVIQQARREIESLSLPLSKADLTLVASRLRHVAEVLSGEPCTTLSAQELLCLAAATPVSPVAPLFRFLAELDQMRFAPEISAERAATCHSAALQLLGALPEEPT